MQHILDQTFTAKRKATCRERLIFRHAAPFFLLLLPHRKTAPHLCCIRSRHINEVVVQQCLCCQFYRQASLQAFPSRALKRLCRFLFCEQFCCTRKGSTELVLFQCDRVGKTQRLNTHYQRVYLHACLCWNVFVVSTGCSFNNVDSVKVHATFDLV